MKKALYLPRQVLEKQSLTASSSQLERAQSQRLVLFRQGTERPTERKLEGHQAARHKSSSERAPKGRQAHHRERAILAVWRRIAVDKGGSHPFTARSPFRSTVKTRWNHQALLTDSPPVLSTTLAFSRLCPRVCRRTRRVATLYGEDRIGGTSEVPS